ncbi:FabD/lysophospholipase-like protein [Myriangium duriaei CBS 260.36]|uniref:FabD/lysophospholipase-like protein n=1 Tax=Myriangium duriaei CBS 260.36 TaxID=1168546 RepID=A0A9P4J6F0_9PEZI|nr:FabD/lysophospholipase-like protein [Myriangium duriaei CBS 260.36]
MLDRQVNLLCIDGGGVKGLSALLLIRKLMEFIDSENPPKPCEHFDMIGGTNTGGLIAIMLGRLRMTVDECIDHYLSLHDSVFLDNGIFELRDRYNDYAMEESVKDVLRSKNIDEDTLLKDTEDTACKV